MANVYSVSLWTTAAQVGNATGPTVPSGFVWVVRTITVFCAGPAASSQGPVLFQWGGSFPIAGWTRRQLEGGLTVTWDGHHVVPSEQYLNVVNTPPGAVAWTVSGYQLTLP